MSTVLHMPRDSTVLETCIHIDIDYTAYFCRATSHVCDVSVYVTCPLSALSLICVIFHVPLMSTFLTLCNETWNVCAWLSMVRYWLAPHTWLTWMTLPHDTLQLCVCRFELEAHWILAHAVMCSLFWWCCVDCNSLWRSLNGSVLTWTCTLEVH